MTKAWHVSIDSSVRTSPRPGWPFETAVALQIQEGLDRLCAAIQQAINQSAPEGNQVTITVPITVGWPHTPEAKLVD